jgi:hypothetical protein
MPPLSGGAAGGAAARTPLSLRVGRVAGGGLEAVVAESRFGVMAVAGSGAGAAGDGGGGVEDTREAFTESVRALSDPSVVERVVESGVESFATAPPGASAPLDRR